MPSLETVQLLLPPLAAFIQCTPSEARRLEAPQPLLPKHGTECYQQTARQARVRKRLDLYGCRARFRPDEKSGLLCWKRGIVDLVNQYLQNTVRCVACIRTQARLYVYSQKAKLMPENTDQPKRCLRLTLV
jgi:hypothetical protein